MSYTASTTMPSVQLPAVTVAPPVQVDDRNVIKGINVHNGTLRLSGRIGLR